jgi:hypothetical protein
MKAHIPKNIKPDAKGRICLGSLAKNVSSYHVVIDQKQRIILEPFVEIPASEQWLFANKPALKQLKKGLQDVASKKLIDRGSFSHYVDEE